MNWSKPHISKVYEALGAIADKRIEISPDKNEAKMYSSSKGKFYTVTWNDDFTAMMSNDNSAFYVGQLSYPMISVLMMKGKISYDPKMIELLKDIKWKDINKKFKNNVDKTVEFVLEGLGADAEFVKNETERILKEVEGLNIEYFGQRTYPPKGY
ncbi:MAG: hypothetical protein ABI721_04200 [Candidatus Dojkabacteria bacterium]